MSLTPVGVYALKVPAGGILIPALPEEAAAAFRISMAAIDPTEEPEIEGNETKTPRATLKIVRIPGHLFDEDSEDDEDYEDIDSDEEDSEGENGGPSDPSKAKLLSQLMEEAEDDDEDEGSDDEVDIKAAISKLIKGKGPANDDDDEEDSDDEDEDLEMDEAVICTLDAEKYFQQTLDIAVQEDERIFFKVDGAFTVHLTGNYVMPVDDHDHDHDDYDEDDYDLSPDEDELELEDGEESDDDLDGLDDPRVMEVDSEEEEAPKLVKAEKGKKRAADEEDLDNMITQAANEEKLSKKQQKKLKKNNGDAAEAPKADAKKVQFAKNLEQGPTGPAKEKEAAKPAEAFKMVQGIKVEDKKAGSGPAAKKGDKLQMRYIGKLQNGSVFDSNKKGTPFSFKLGAGEVIKGWDLGLVGMAPGGERRITVPAKMAYGNKALPGIPANSTLIFEVKLLAIK